MSWCDDIGWICKEQLPVPVVEKESEWEELKMIITLHKITLPLYFLNIADIRQLGREIERSWG